MRQSLHLPAAVLHPRQPRVTLPALVGVMVVCSCCYGAAMGTFGGLAPERLLQVLFSALKLPLLLSATFLLGLPAFFVLNTLLGVRADFADALRALVRSQAGLAVVLVSLAPYTLLWYQSSAYYPVAILINGLMFAIASGVGQAILRRGYRPLIARAAIHRTLLRIWLVLYVFVGIQMAWVLRPFIGTPGMAVRFFREDSWGNAYLAVARIVWDALPR
jgi:hypothetical protein